MALKWKTAIVVGASSGIGADISRQLAAQGCRVALVSRRESELAQIAAEIDQVSGSNKTLIYIHDVTCYEAVPALFQQICRDLGGLDVIFYTAGVMPRIRPDEYDFSKDRVTVEVNLLGAIAWLNEAAQRFSAGNAGTIVGISSPSADRGRRGFPVYGATKAALENYLESLRNRLAKHGVRVVTIKPGPVDTPMTKGMDKLPMLISSQAAAQQIVRAAAAGKQLAYVPGKWRPIMFIIRNIPSFLFKKMKI
jgi:NAD(P)-dependent dehydrogenase (short-subunit alcohol dehydrogenase family)